MSKDFFEQVNNSTTGDELTAYAASGKSALMIYGDVDTVINPETYTWTIANTGIDYICIPGMDHFLGLADERPDIVNLVINLTISRLYYDLAG
jgi:hypothetical protein